jgi:hypothetical protein
LSDRRYSSAVRFLRTLSVGLTMLALAGCGAQAGSASPRSAASPSGIVVGGSGAPSVFPVVVNSEFGVGRTRFLFVLVDSSNNPVSSPDRSADVAFVAPGATSSPSPAPATFLWGIENVRGYYVANVDLDRAGDWTASIRTAAKGGSPETTQVPFQVKDKTSAVAVGQKAPSVKTPTLSDVGGDASKIATDTDPNPDFYTVSEDQALAEHKPFALVFATPKFCTSQLCGPQLDTVKAVAKSYPSVTFINVEPYKLELKDGQLQPVLDASGNLQPVPAVGAFGILSEPWLYVVDKTGTITGSFEGVFSEQELRAALDQVK